MYISFIKERVKRFGKCSAKELIFSKNGGPTKKIDFKKWCNLKTGLSKNNSEKIQVQNKRGPKKWVFTNRRPQEKLLKNGVQNSNSEKTEILKRSHKKHV